MIIKKYSQKKLNKPVQQEIPEEASVQEVVEEPAAQEPVQDAKDIFAGFNFDEIDFNQRAERRRGDRRRGYRRIDDRNLISRAQQEAISIKEQASKEGFEKGLEEAKSALGELKGSINEFFEYKETLYNQIAGDILDIALKVAQKIIKKEVETDKAVLDSIVRDALKSLAKDENKIILKVAPVDVEYVKELAVSLGKLVIVDPAPAVEGVPDHFWKGKKARL